jgi:hypothetical protein
MSKDLVPTLSDEQRLALTDAKSPYSAEDRVKVCMAYLITNNSVKAAAMVNDQGLVDVKPNTIRQWIARSPWWGDGMEAGRALLQHDLDNAYTKLLHATEKELYDRVTQGDEVILASGERTRVPVKAKDLVYIHGVVADKQARLRGESLGGGSSTDPVDQLIRLANALKGHGEKQIPAIEGEWEEIPDVE